MLAYGEFRWHGFIWGIFDMPVGIGDAKELGVDMAEELRVDVAELI